jgi:hypothetical protein
MSAVNIPIADGGGITWDANGLRFIPSERSSLIWRLAFSPPFIGLKKYPDPVDELLRGFVRGETPPYVLADALEEAGLEDPYLFEVLRDPKTCALGLPPAEEPETGCPTVAVATPREKWKAERHAVRLAARNARRREAGLEDLI